MPPMIARRLLAFREPVIREFARCLNAGGATLGFAACGLPTESRIHHIYQCSRRNRLSVLSCIETEQARGLCYEDPPPSRRPSASGRPDAVRKDRATVPAKGRERHVRHERIR